MNSKRTRVSGPDDQPDAALICELFDTLTQASRKHHHLLLALLLKHSSRDTLNMVRAEAMQAGLIVHATSKFQTATHQLLHGCFSFLSRRDIASAEIVCSRWKTACSQGAGYASILCRVPLLSFDADWFAEVAKRRLSPMQLAELTRFEVSNQSNRDILAFAARLPSLRDLVVFGSPAPEDVRHFAQHAMIQSIALHCHYYHDFLKEFEKFRCASRLPKLELTRVNTLAPLLSSTFPALNDLTVKMVEYQDSTSLTACLTSLTRLTTLRLQVPADEPDEPEMHQQERLAPLAQLTSLQTLSLTVVEDFEDLPKPYNNQFVTSLTSLCHLFLPFFKVKRDVQLLESLPHLTTFGCQYVRRKHFQPSGFARLTRLTSLALKNVDFDQELVDGLDDIVTLAGECSFDDAAEMYWFRLPPKDFDQLLHSFPASLTRLELANWPLEREGLIQARELFKQTTIPSKRKAASKRRPKSRQVRYDRYRVPS